MRTPKGLKARPSDVILEIGDTTTVEPGEPDETGVRTQWWVWTAPEDGRYTWRIQGTETHLQVTAFAGPAGAREVNLEDLSLIGATGPYLTSTEFVFDAVAERRYWIAAGIPMGDLAAFAESGMMDNLAWGPTPENDSLANASSLAGASGTVSGSNEFATTDRGERVGRFGHSSLWWTWEAPAAGWYRFWVDDASSVLAAYQAGGDGFGGLDLIAISYAEQTDISEELGEGRTEILLYAEPGVRYTVRLGTLGQGAGEFELQWDEAEPPVWLKYAGRSSPAQLGLERGNSDIGSLAFNELGTTLYMQSGRGLHVLQRDVATGALRSVQVIENGPAASSALIWDARRTKLYARYGRAWHRFTPIGENRRKLRSDPFAMADAGSYYGDAVFMDPDGQFLYSIEYSTERDIGIEVFAFESSDVLRHVQSLEFDGLLQALMSNSGEYVHAVDPHSHWLAFKRNAATGKLTQVSPPPTTTRFKYSRCKR